jgi:hypothetical protein
MSADVCRHCGRPIWRQNDGIRWVHDRPRLTRCRQPEDVAVYGYEALPDDGELCVCWACNKFGPIGIDIDRLVAEALAADEDDPA